jgi:LacI family transcriptional regulator
MAPVISSAAEEMLREIPSETPYLFFDANIEKSESITFIGQNSYDSGVLAAVLMKKIIHRPGIIAAIQPLKDDYHILQRIEGFCSSIKASKDFQVAVYVPEKGGDAASFRRLLKQIISKNSNTRGIFVSNAACHYAADFMANHSLSDIKLIGYDLIEKNVHHLRNGVIDFLVCQRPENQGFEGIHILHRFMAFGEKAEKQICMPLDIVTAENLKYYQHL